MKQLEEPAVEQPPLLRLTLFFGRPLGITFVPQHHMQAIYRMGQYVECRGPGLIYHSPLTESLGPQVFVGNQRNEYRFENIVSRDVLPVTIAILTSVVYDPVVGHARASVLTRLPREAYVSIAGTYLRWGLLAAANRYNAAELTQADVRNQLENVLHAQVSDELKFLGLRLAAKLRIMSVELPAVLTERHETIAQRRATILAGAEFSPAEYRRALVSEVLERLSQGNAESFVNFSEILEAYAAEHPAQGGAQPSTPPRILDQSPLALEDKSRTQVDQPLQGAEDETPPVRPKSRL
jgi:hypothetical protein